MSDTEVLDKTFHFILKRMVDTGQAPYYTEIAAELGVSPEDGRQTMHTLFEFGTSISPPFSNSILFNTIGFICEEYKCTNLTKILYLHRMTPFLSQDILPTIGQ
jgi:hypothetical protein